MHPFLVSILNKQSICFPWQDEKIMMQIQSFTFNPFAENTYVLFDETHECVIIDPGCYTENERMELDEFITRKNLKPVKLINTHAHIDHILGNNHVVGKYNLNLEMHPADETVLKAATVYGEMWGIQVEPSPKVSHYLKEGDEVIFGNSRLKILFTPGHSPGSICLYDEEDQIVIAGDVLFYGSIGRTDLPGGDYDTLIGSIRKKLFVLADNVKVFPGHGPATTIGFERVNNPFLQ